jgi:hypothetical protein
MDIDDDDFYAPDDGQNEQVPMDESATPDMKDEEEDEESEEDGEEEGEEDEDGEEEEESDDSSVRWS